MRVRNPLNKLKLPINRLKLPGLIAGKTKPAGAPPGELVHVGEKRTDAVTISWHDYDMDNISSGTAASPAECSRFLDTATTTWINVSGIHDPEIISQFGELFGIHPLVLEDIMNTNQRPKVEDFGDYIFIVLKMIFTKEPENELTVEHLSIIAGRGYAITFQETAGDVFNPIRERMKKPAGRFRKHGAGYLAYALVDIIVDNYLIAVNGAGEEIENMEDAVALDNGQDTLDHVPAALQAYKKTLRFFRRTMTPVRDIAGALARSESDIIDETTAVFFRDVNDHIIHVTESIDVFREMLTALHDMHVTNLSNRMNEIMKVLTLIATIFIPLTFLAGIYGMNFEHMPELGWKWSYPLFWVVIIIAGAVMVTFFRKKKWL